MNQNKIQSQVRLIDFSLLQEIKTSEKIKQLKEYTSEYTNEYTKYTNPILKVSDITIAYKTKYSLVEKIKYPLFLNELKKMHNQKEYFVNLIQYYHSFISLLDFLERNGIVSLSCEINNIYLNEQQPIISTYIFLDDLDMKKLDNINVYYLPYSAHVLHFLNTECCDGTELSSNNMNEISDTFITGLDKLHIFSKDYLKEYAKECTKECTKEYKRQGLKECIKENIIKWSHFSVAIMFLILLNKLPEDTWIYKFKQHLLDIIMQNKKNELFI